LNFWGVSLFISSIEIKLFFDKFLIDNFLPLIVQKIKSMQHFSENISLFPGTEWLNHPVVEQTEYLVDGEFKQWNGDFKKVYSAIKVNNKEKNEEDEHTNIYNVPVGSLGFGCLHRR
jgi:hypothetical protein